jgi:ribonuclease HI
LDHPLRWSVVPCGGRHRGDHNITRRRQVQIHNMPQLRLESNRCTNNIAEYEAVILGLRKLQALGVTTCIIRIDSKVVADQVKEYSAKDPTLM